MSRSDSLRSHHRNKAAQEVDGQAFGEALRRIKADKGLTWSEMAQMVGRAQGTLPAYAFGRKRWVSKAVAEDILQRLAGANLPPTPRQAIEYETKARLIRQHLRQETTRESNITERKALIASLRERFTQG